MRPSAAAPLALLAGILLLAASPARAGGIKCEDSVRAPCLPPIGSPEGSAFLYSLEEGLVLLVHEDFELDDVPGFFPPDAGLVDFEDLTHGSSDAYALTQICVSNPLCGELILGAGPSGRQDLRDALFDVYGFETNGGPPDLPVPEPGTAALLGLGLGALVLARRSDS